MRPAETDARRRLIALLLARGEIGSSDARRERVDEAAERDVAVDGEAGGSVDRAA